MAATWELISARSVRSVQAETEEAPALATDGVSLVDVAAATFILDTGEGHTIAEDVGQIDFYVLDGAGWALAPLLPFSVPPGSAGRRRVVVGTVQIDNPRGRIAPIANGISSSGTLVIVEVLVTMYDSRLRLPR